jgi:hypothetical protein
MPLTLPVCGLILVVLAGMAGVPRAHGLDWGLIEPGVTAMDAVRSRYGEPSSATTQKVDNYDTAQWVYEGERAPVGMERMVVDFGLLTPESFRPQIVRSVLLHPKPGSFTRSLVVQGWGMPTAVGQQSGAPAYMYEEGLFVLFDAEGSDVTTMLFTPRQKIPAESAPPR